MSDPHLAPFRPPMLCYAQRRCVKPMRLDDQLSKPEFVHEVASLKPSRPSRRREGDLEETTSRKRDRKFEECSVCLEEAGFATFNCHACGHRIHQLCKTTWEVHCADNCMKYACPNCMVQ